MICDFVNSYDIELIHDEYICIIYSYIGNYINEIKLPIDIFNCICVHNYIQDNKPSFQDLLEHNFYAKVSLNILKLICKTVNLSYSESVKMEKIIGLLYE